MKPQTRITRDLLAAMGTIVLALAVSGCESASAQPPASAQAANRQKSKSPQQPRQVKYFGDEFAEAQQALKSKPVAEIPATF